MRCWAEVVPTFDDKEQTKICVAWLEESYECMLMEYRGGKYKLKSGLASGTRLTDWFNTVFNRIYVKITLRAANFMVLTVL